MEDLMRDLQQRIAVCEARDRRNYFTAFALLTMSVVASAATAVAVAIELFPKVMIAALATAPGIFILIGATFRFEQRARWYWRKRIRLEKLLRCHKFEDMPAAEVSKRWNAIDEDMFQEWPGFGAGMSQRDGDRLQERSST